MQYLFLPPITNLKMLSKAQLTLTIKIISNNDLWYYKRYCAHVISFNLYDGCIMPYPVEETEPQKS